ncbi:hypothetical protein, partial [Pseudomonas helleri]|uniref:hypothetical protein n=1 Tax=Pseudomonas helleri TaxID=1608996 RepID=UPI003F9A39CC
QKRKPRLSGVLQTVSLTSFSLHHPGGILRVRVVALSFLLYVLETKITHGSNFAIWAIGST